MTSTRSAPPPCFEFRPLRAGDLPLMLEWLNRPHLQRWWREGEVTIEYVREHYLPRIAGTDTVRPFLARLGDEPIGYIQVYRADEVPGWWPDTPDAGARGVDLFLGDPERLEQGLGTAVLRAFVELVMEDPSVTEIRVDPHPSNGRAIRCYEKAGFERRGPIDTPDGPAIFMVLARPGAPASAQE